MIIRNAAWNPKVLESAVRAPAAVPFESPLLRTRSEVGL